MKPRDLSVPGGIELAGEALHLLRRAPLPATAAYLVGTLPFVFGLLYFWTDMSRSAFAHERCLGAALGLAVLYVWMKAWQAWFGSGLRAFILGREAPRWTVRGWLRLATTQTALQWHGFITIPVAVLVMFPLPAVHAFYQNATVLADDTESAPGSLARRSWRLALLWPAQNSVIIWLLSPWLLGLGLGCSFGMVRAMVSMIPDLYEAANILWFILSLIVMAHVVLPFSFLGCLIAGNIAVLLVAIPWLLDFLFGLDTVFSLASWHAIFNSTFIMTVFALSYLCMDPMNKAAHALRCFHGESLRTGDDLRVELDSIPPGGPGDGPAASTRSHNRAAWVLLIAALLILPAASRTAAAEAAMDPGHPPSAALSAETLDQAIGRIVARPEYSWRLPREREVPSSQPAGFWNSTFGQSADWLKDILRKLWRLSKRLDRWLERLFQSRDNAPPGAVDWPAVGWITVYVSAIVAASFAGILFYRMWRQRRGRPTPVQAEPLTITTEMLEDTAIADKLPSDEWMNLARRLIEQGEVRLALRAMFLASLAFLAHHGTLTIARHKSNRDYLGELRRKSHDRPVVLEAFAENVEWVERVWYGRHPAAPALIDRLSENLSRISSQLVAPPAGRRP